MKFSTVFIKRLPLNLAEQFVIVGRVPCEPMAVIIDRSCFSPSSTAMFCSFLFLSLLLTSKVLFDSTNNMFHRPKNQKEPKKNASLIYSSPTLAVNIMGRVLYEMNREIPINQFDSNIILAMLVLNSFNACKIDVSINSKKIYMEVDTGASISVMDKIFFVEFVGLFKLVLFIY